jgi:hypothetical protein
MLSAMTASDALQTVAAENFGSEGRRYFDPDAAKKLEAQLKAATDAKIETTGDKATATLAGTDGSTAQTKVLQKSADGWHIDGASLLGPAGEPAEKLAARVALWKKSAAVADKVAADIKAKKYPLASDAFRDYVKLMSEAATETTAPSPSTTAATVPATQPH